MKKITIYIQLLLEQVRSLESGMVVQLQFHNIQQLSFCFQEMEKRNLTQMLEQRTHIY